MSDGAQSTAGGRLLLAFEMADLGIALMRENLRRRFPEEPAGALDQRLAAWLAGPDPIDTDLRMGTWEERLRRRSAK
jgi:hypothetical protein